MTRREGDSRTEVGLQWSVPDGDWNQDEFESAELLSLPASADSGGEAILVLRASTTGLIEVRPYLRAFPEKAPDVRDLGCRVAIEAFGKGVSLGKSPAPIAITWLGRVGQVVEIQIDRSAE